jgi:hypothetical protein
MGAMKAFFGAAQSKKCEEMVGWQGLEPWTNALKGHCSTS